MHMLLAAVLNVITDITLKIKSAVYFTVKICLNSTDNIFSCYCNDHKSKLALSELQRGNGGGGDEQERTANQIIHCLIPEKLATDIPCNMCTSERPNLSCNFYCCPKVHHTDV
jgi:hypothetical protein